MTALTTIAIIRPNPDGTITLSIVERGTLTLSRSQAREIAEDLIVAADSLAEPGGGRGRGGVRGRMPEPKPRPVLRWDDVHMRKEHDMTTTLSRLDGARAVLELVPKVCERFGFDPDLITAISLDGLSYEDPSFLLHTSQPYTPREELRTIYFPKTDDGGDFWSLRGEFGGARFRVIMRGAGA